MSVWKIAGGVFLGNLLFALLAWALVLLLLQRPHQLTLQESIESQAEQLREQSALRNEALREQWNATNAVNR